MSSNRFRHMASRPSPSRRAAWARSSGGSVGPVMAGSAAVAGPAIGHQEPQNGTDSDTGDDGGIGIGSDGSVRGMGAFDRLVPGAGVTLFDGRPESLPGFGDVFAGDVGRCGEERAGVTGQLLDVVADGVGLAFEGWMGGHGCRSGHDGVV